MAYVPTSVIIGLYLFYRHLQAFGESIRTPLSFFYERKFNNLYKYQLRIIGVTKQHVQYYH